MYKAGLRARTVLGCIALALPCFARADAPDSSLLGDVAALANFCASLDRAAGDSAEKLRQQLSQQFGAATSSDAYRDAYEKMSDALKNLNRQTAYALCGVTPPGTDRHDPKGR